MVKAKRARKAETLKQPSLCLRLRAPHFYPDYYLTLNSLNRPLLCQRSFNIVVVGSAD
jgi:hypothetical protein